MTKISPSILAADFFNLSEVFEKLEKAGVDMIHLDVMDGLFVPNLSFGAPVIAAIKKNTKIMCDVHLMIDRPHRYIKDFAEISDYLGFHFEAGSPVKETLLEIKKYGAKSCLTIKPCTSPEEIFEFLPYCDMVLVMSVEPGFGGQKFMPEALDKLRVLKNEIRRQNLDILLEVDGGINEQTAPLAVEAGADVLVAGTYFFNAEDMASTAEKIKKL